MTGRGLNMDLSATEHEAARLGALSRYSDLDISADATVRGITSLVAEMLDVPHAAVSLVDREAINFEAQHGFDVGQIDRMPGLCAASILESTVYHIRDATKDATTKNNPMVTGPFGVRFYAAAPLRTPDGFNIGTLCAIDQKPRDLADSESAVLQRLATIVMSQLEFELTADKVARLERDQQSLRRQLEEANVALAESEERYRDLFDEAPIAYVHEDLDSRFIRANRTALRILGLKPEEAIGMVGKTLVADTPDAQAELQDAFASINRGAYTDGVVLEMRRKDDGSPVWIQWWSRPAPDGSYTRTMFLDITDRVMMEREKTRLQAQNTYLREEI